jgi:hypothetical protein
MAEVVYYRFTPMVIDENQQLDAILEVRVSGPVSSVKLQLESSNVEIPLYDNGTQGDKIAGDGIYTTKIKMSYILHNFTPDDVNRNFVGFLHLYSGKQKGEYNVFTDILTSKIPQIRLRKVANDVQYSEHLVNIVSSNFFTNFDLVSLIQKFYSHFEDNYDFLNVVYEISYMQNRYHEQIQNTCVQGIGYPISPSGGYIIKPKTNANYFGSNGRVLGYTIFPCPTFFDGASPDYQHELCHQWVNFLNMPPLNSALPHWPLSDLASGIMGYGKGIGTQGLDFNYSLLPSGPNYQCIPNNDPKEFTDLSLYLMGLIPDNQVTNHFVFDDQNQQIQGTGTPGQYLLKGPVTNVIVQDISANLGPRNPPYGKAKKKFRIATIIVSKDGLLSKDAMRLYDFFSARAEKNTIVQYSSGLKKGITKPFHLATRGEGKLDTRIKRYILVDASRDGGVWWFPQTTQFSSIKPHQGKKLATYFRSLGHKVRELPRKHQIDSKLLKDFNIVIRTVGFGSYLTSEISAYQNYVAEGGYLLLLSDHGPPDDLAMSFGLKFQGTTRGENVITKFAGHPLTKQQNPLSYYVGGGLTSYSPNSQILGWVSNKTFLDLNNNLVKDPGEPTGFPVFGAMVHGKGRIVFCGDANLFERVPQPLIRNLLHWFAD